MSEIKLYHLSDERHLSKDVILKILLNQDELIYGYFKNSDGRLIMDQITMDNIHDLEDDLEFRLSEESDNKMVGYPMVYDEYESGGVHGNTHKGAWRFCFHLADEYNVRMGRYPELLRNSGVHRHHKDENKLNSNPDNIIRLTASEHATIHANSLAVSHTAENQLRSRAAINFSYIIKMLKDLKGKHGYISEELYDAEKYNYKKTPAKWQRIMEYCDGDLEKLNYMIDNYDSLLDAISEVKRSGKVYLAGGWFDDEQAERLEAVKNIIVDAGFEIFAPKDEALCEPDSDQDWRKIVFDGNCSAINNCSFMVNITDKKDMGTIFEAGLAYALHRPIIYFAETLGNNKFNLMLAQSGVAVASSRDKLKSLLRNPILMECILNNSKYEGFEGDIE